MDHALEKFGVQPLQHISDVRPEGYRILRPTLGKIGNHHVNTIHTPSKVFGPNWLTHSRNGNRRRYKVHIDRSWDLTRKGALEFVENTRGRRWVSQRKTLYFFICQVNNPKSAMEHALNPPKITPEHCYQLTT